MHVEQDVTYCWDFLLGDFLYWIHQKVQLPGRVPVPSLKYRLDITAIKEAVLIVR